MKFDFTGKRALVTGAGSGIGRATAIKLAELGAHVVALSRTQQSLDTLKAECPKIETLCVDLKEWDSSREAIKKVTPIHLLVNNSGISILAPVLEATPEAFDSIFTVNLKAVMNVSQVIAKDLIEKKLQGSFVNVSSQASQRALQNHLLYCASKAALDSFTRSMALELAPKGIRVNSTNPTVVMTIMGRMAWSDEKKSGPVLSRIPQGKFATVEHVVNSIIYLLSDYSDMVNGHTLAVEGGFLIS